MLLSINVPYPFHFAHFIRAAAATQIDYNSYTYLYLHVTHTHTRMCVYQCVTLLFFLYVLYFFYGVAQSIGVQ